MHTFSSRQRRSGLFALVALVSLAMSAGVGYASTGTHTGSTAATHVVIKQTSAQGQYGSTGPVKPAPVKNVKDAVYKPPAAAKPVVTAETLPFTGISLVGFVVLGAALVGVGIAIFRRGESRR
jgi:hypothetical protein